MSTFKDDSGREWTLRLDYAKARQLRESLSLDFVDFDGTLQTFAKVDSSLDVLMSVVKSLTAAQRDTKQLSDEQFEAGFCGESFEAVRAALEECAINFSSPRERENLKRALTTQTTMRKELVANLVSRMNQPSQTTEPSAATGG